MALESLPNGSAPTDTPWVTNLSSTLSSPATRSMPPSPQVPTEILLLPGKAPKMAAASVFTGKFLTTLESRSATNSSLTLRPPAIRSSVDIAMADDGSFVAVWQSGGNLDGNGEGIFAQRFDANGVTLGDEFLVNTTTTGNQTAPAIAMSGATGDFVVVWQDDDNNRRRYFCSAIRQRRQPVATSFLSTRRP